MATVFRSSSAIESVEVDMQVTGEHGEGYAPFGPPVLGVGDLGSLVRLEDKVRMLSQDLEAEREIRNRIERERSDLSVQLINLTDRCDEAEVNSENQVETNRKREFELNNLRKLLEETEIEREDNMSLLRRKHQDAILDYQEQIEGLNKKNAKIDRERERLQHEVIEMTASLEQTQKDKLVAEKAAEKFEAESRELADRAEDLFKHVNDLTQQKIRLQNLNNDLLKELHDVKSQVDNLLHIKAQLMQQLEETRKRLEDAEEERAQMQTQLHQVQLDLDAVRSSLEEEATAREEVEHKLTVAQMESLQWKSKYEAEVTLHHEEVEDMRKKLVIMEAEYEEKIEYIVQKTSQLEKTKSRLQSEVEALIIDLEKAQNSIALLERVKEQLEILSSELTVRVKELKEEVDASQRELRATLIELKKVTDLHDKAVEEREKAARENEQLLADLEDCNAALSDANQKLHELDLENSRLAGEVRELQTGLNEEEDARRFAENKAQRAVAELQATRVDMERRLHDKQEEMETMRQNMQFEVDRLTNALADIESRMKAEIAFLKKKYGAEVAHLEVTVDNLNRSNIECQKTIKKQAEQLRVLQASYDEAQRQLQETLDAYAVTQRTISNVATELEECRAALDNTIRARKHAEAEMDEAHARITDLTAINNNLSATKARLEVELERARIDLDTATRALRDAEERERRALLDAEHALDQLKEEQQHAAKLEAMKRALEEQVRQLQVEIQEAEAAALLGSKRVMSKLETRVRDLETALDEETRRHKETEITIQKKERKIKETLMQLDEEHTAFLMTQDSAEKLSEKINLFKRQVADAEALSMQHMQRARRYQHELEEAEARVSDAESSLSLIRVKHVSSVVAGSVESPSVYVMEEAHEG